MGTIELLQSLTEAQKQGIRNMFSVGADKYKPFFAVYRYPYQDSSNLKVTIEWCDDLNEIDILASCNVFSTSILEHEINAKYKHLF